VIVVIFENIYFAMYCSDAVRCGRIFISCSITNFPTNLPVKYFWKSANICQRYGQTFAAYFFDGHPV